jgi:hypothetical protein
MCPVPSAVRFPTRQRSHNLDHVRPVECARFNVAL